jgi:hypothetical protein
MTVTLTLELEAADANELLAQAQAAGVDSDELATRMLRRQLYRLTGPARGRKPTGGRGNVERAAERTARQLALAEHVRRKGFPDGQLEKRALAERFGVNERTLYRDLETVKAALEKVPAPAPRPVRRRPSLTDTQAQQAQARPARVAVR